jgi:hypothetical protein
LSNRRVMPDLSDIPTIVYEHIMIWGSHQQPTNPAAKPFLQGTLLFAQNSQRVFVGGVLPDASPPSPSKQILYHLRWVLANWKDRAAVTPKPSGNSFLGCRASASALPEFTMRESLD